MGLHPRSAEALGGFAVGIVRACGLRVVTGHPLAVEVEGQLLGRVVDGGVRRLGPGATGASTNVLGLPAPLRHLCGSRVLALGKSIGRQGSLAWIPPFPHPRHLADVLGNAWRGQRSARDLLVRSRSSGRLLLQVPQLLQMSLEAHPVDEAVEIRTAPLRGDGDRLVHFASDALLGCQAVAEQRLSIQAMGLGLHLPEYGGPPVALDGRHGGRRAAGERYELHLLRAECR